MPQKKDVLNHEFHCIRTLRLSCCPDNINIKLKRYFYHKTQRIRYVSISTVHSINSYFCYNVFSINEAAAEEG